MSNLKKDIEKILKDFVLWRTKIIDGKPVATYDKNMLSEWEREQYQPMEAVTQIINLIESVIPEEKVLEVEEPRLYQGVGGGSAPFFCSGCQMSEMDIMENYDEQDGRYYCRCSFWDTPHNAFLDKSGGNWLGWKNKQAAQEYLNNLPTEEAGYNQAIKDIKSKLIDGEKK